MHEQELSPRTSSRPLSSAISAIKALATIYFIMVVLGASTGGTATIIARSLLCATALAYTFRSTFNFSSWITRKSGVIAFFIAQFLCWIALVVVEYSSFSFNNFDTGIFANQIYAWHKTGRYYSSILGMHAFGDHFTPNLLLISPLFYIAKSFLWLPYVKILAWATGVALLIKFSKDVLGKDSPYAFLVPAIYLANRFVSATLLMEFQPSSLAVPFVIFAFILANTERLKTLVCVLIFTLGFKEHMGVLWISTGLFLALEKGQLLFGSIIALIGCIEGPLVYTWVMPIFAQGSVHHDHRIGLLFFLGKKVNLLLQSILSFGLLPLFAPLSILYALPGFVLILMAKDPTMVALSHHYHDIAFAMLACASVLGLKKVTTSTKFPLSFSSRHICTLATIVVLAQGMKFPTQAIIKEWPTPETSALHRDLQTIRTFLEETHPSEVWTLDSIGPNLFYNLGSKSLLTPTDPPASNEQISRAIIISDAAPKYPFSEQSYQDLKRHLESNYREMHLTAPPLESARVFVQR